MIFWEIWKGGLRITNYVFRRCVALESCSPPAPTCQLLICGIKGIISRHCKTSSTSNRQMATTWAAFQPREEKSTSMVFLISCVCWVPHVHTGPMDGIQGQVNLARWIFSVMDKRKMVVRGNKTGGVWWSCILYTYITNMYTMWITQAKKIRSFSIFGTNWVRGNKTGGILIREAAQWAPINMLGAFWVMRGCKLALETWRSW